MNKEDWINDVFNSIEGITHVKPAEDFTVKVLAKCNRTNIIIVPNQKLRWIAAAAIMIILLNASTIVFFSIKGKTNYKINNNDSYINNLLPENSYNY